MFGKLVYGKFSLKETFWKFGVLCIFALALISRIFKALLLHKIGGATIGFYYAHKFSFLNMDNAILFYTIAYFVFAAVLMSRKVGRYVLRVAKIWTTKTRRLMMLQWFDGFRLCQRKKHRTYTACCTAYV